MNWTLLLMISQRVRWSAGITLIQPIALYRIYLNWWPSTENCFKRRYLPETHFQLKSREIAFVKIMISFAKSIRNFALSRTVWVPCSALNCEPNGQIRSKLRVNEISCDLKMIQVWEGHRTWQYPPYTDTHYTELLLASWTNEDCPSNCSWTRPLGQALCSNFPSGWTYRSSTISACN